MYVLTMPIISFLPSGPGKNKAPVNVTLNGLISRNKIIPPGEYLGMDPQKGVKVFRIFLFCG
jgi:hypothetical protein